MNEIIQRMNEIKSRRTEIRGIVEAGGEADLAALETELRSLETEMNALEARKKLLEGINNGSVPATSIPNPITPPAASERGGTDPEVEERAAYMRGVTGDNTSAVVASAKRFSETNYMTLKTGAVKRSLTISSGGIAKPTKVSEIQDGQNEVSGIIDMVRVVNAEGMGSDSVPYETTGSSAGIGTDGSVPSTSDPGFATATIEPILVNTLCYVSKHIQRLTPLNYQSRVTKSALAALRKKIAKLIVTGDTTATPKEICGIINAAAVQSASDLSISAIDATTLRKIALGFGGDENVEGNCVLLLNKKDLIAFGDIRGTNEKKAVYEISYDAGSSTCGTIKDGGLAVRFCINSACNALSDSNVAANSYTMLYGKTLAYQLDLFGDYEISVSKDYKFAEGLLSVLGEVMVGGNVIAYNGWTRVKKTA